MIVERGQDTHRLRAGAVEPSRRKNLPIANAPTQLVSSLLPTGRAALERWGLQGMNGECIKPVAAECEVVGEDIEHRRELGVDKGSTAGRAKAKEKPVEKDQLAGSRHQPLVRLHWVNSRQQVRVVAHLQEKVRLDRILTI